MSNRAALFLAIAILVLFALDAVLHDWAWTIFLCRRGLDLISWLQFWR